MGRAIQEIKEVKVPSGYEFRAICRSDRGTKYIANSVVVIPEVPGQRPTDAQVEAAVKQLIEEQN